MRRALGVILACTVVCLVRAGTEPAYRGRPLVDVLEELRAQGLNLIYSTAVVGEQVVVTVEPTASAPRALLDEILAPLGLEARDGPGGAVLVLAAERTRSGTVRGRVVSAGRRRAIARAAVTVEGNGARALSSPDGTFTLAGVPPGSTTLRFGAPGFVDRVVEGLTVPPGRTVVLEVTLLAQPGYLEEIVVTPSRHAVVQQEQTSRLSIDREDAVLVPTIGGDVSRVIERLPGVAGPDNSAAFGIRGSEARDVAFVLDGLELYEPFHLLSFQSPFSFVDNEIVDTIDVLGGGFTADFGDRYGGFVELTTAAPTDSARTRVELGSLNSGVAFGTALRSGSLLLSARAWYPEALRDSIELGESGLDPRFADVYLKYSLALSPRTVLSAHALLARDRLDYVEPDGAEQVDADDRSAYLWLRALQSWTPAVLSETLVSFGQIKRSRTGVSDPEDEPLLVDDERTVDFVGLSQDVSWEISDRHLLKGGVEVRPLEADYTYSTGPPGEVETLAIEPSGTSLAAYASHRVAFTDDVAAELGLRWDRQTHTDDEQVSPRLNAVWRAGPRSELRLGLGRFFQSQRIHELSIEDGEQDFRPAELSEQVDATFLRLFPGKLRLRLDAYYRELRDLQPRYENLFNPLELFPETEEDRALVAPDRARSRGVELLLRGDTGEAFHWWLSYAWSSAEDVVNGNGVPRRWDQTHAGKLLVARRWRNGWSVTLSGTVHTGWPTTPVTGRIVTLPDGSTGIEEVLGPRNSDRFPTYARLDLKAARVFTLRGSRLRLELEVVNLTDRDNVCCVDEFLFASRPDGSLATAVESDYWLGITPSFSLLWEF